MAVDQAENLRAMTGKGQKKRPRVISVSSGKGGVGKSNITVNLGIALAGLNAKTLLLDGDLGLANVNVLMGLIPKHTISAVFDGRKKLNEIILESQSGLQIVAGASGFSKLADIGPKEKELLLDQFAAFNEYDYILIDTGAGISKNVIDFIIASDEVLVVTTPEPTAITDAYGLIKTIAARDKPIETKLLINRVSSAAEAKSTADRLVAIAEQFLSVTVHYFGWVKDDHHIDKAVREQIPFIEKFPTSPAAYCIKTLAMNIMNLKEVESRESFGDILRKIFLKG